MKEFLKKYKDFLLKKLALPTLVLIWATSYYIEVMGYSVKNHRMIQPLYWIMVVLYIINTLTDLKTYKKELATAESGDSAADELSAKDAGGKGINTKKILLVMACMVGYVIFLNYLGFILTSLLFASTILLIMGERKWYIVLGLSVALTAGLYLAFHFGLRIPLPTGFFNF